MKKEVALLSKFNKNKGLAIIDNQVLIKDGRIIAYDLEQFISIPTDIQGEGVFDLGEIKKVLTKYPDADMQIENEQLIVSKDSKKFKFSGQDPKDYPLRATKVNKIGSLIVDKEFLNLKSFVGNDDFRPALKGVYLDKIKAVATDASKIKVLKDRVNIDTTMIAPSKMFNVPIGRYDVYDTNDSTWFIVSSGGNDYGFRKIDERYPDYTVVIPKWDEMSIALRLPTAELQALLEDCLMVANATTKYVEINTPTSEIGSRDIDTGREYVGKFSPVSKANDINIAFNGEFMKTCLLDAPDISELRFIDSNRPIMINESTVLMPVRKQN